MPLDPAHGLPTTPERKVLDDLADLKRRVRNLEQARPTIQT